MNIGKVIKVHENVPIPTRVEPIRPPIKVPEREPVTVGK